MKFLVVDDSTTMRGIIVQSLIQDGQNDLAEAENGAEGIEILQKGGVDFIVTDWNMPEMNGIEFVKNVRLNPAWRKLPILMITANAIPEEVVEAVKAGITDFIVKPFQGETLRAKVRSLLQGG